MVQHGCLRAGDRNDRDLRQHGAQYSSRARQFNIDFSVIKLTRFGKVETEFRIEAFNLLNHPQFAQPQGQLGNAAFGTISQMLSNPACSLCGTTERRFQMA